MKNNHVNEIIVNAATGDQIEFIQTAENSQGELSKFIMTLAPHSSWAKSPRHFHPFQTETFQVLSGELNLTVGKERSILRSTDAKVTVEKFTLHSFWNETSQPTIFIAEIFPPKNIEKGLRLTYNLSQKGKINKNNIPYNPFYTLLLMDYFDSYFAFFPWKIQRLFFRVGSRIAVVLGYGK